MNTANRDNGPARFQNTPENGRTRLKSISAKWNKLSEQERRAFKYRNDLVGQVVARQSIRKAHAQTDIEAATRERQRRNDLGSTIRPLSLPEATRAGNMTINFPNDSRSYDATRGVVRFWGYDRSMESAFFLMADALQKLQPDMQFEEADVLRAFDSNRARIYAAAAKVYARGRRGSYDINVADV